MTDDYLVYQVRGKIPFAPRACLKNHFHNLHALLCSIFCLNLVCVARCDVPSGQNFLQIVMHILQKIFFKHALKKKATEQKGLLVTE